MFCDNYFNCKQDLFSRIWNIFRYLLGYGKFFGGKDYSTWRCNSQDEGGGHGEGGAYYHTLGYSLNVNVFAQIKIKNTTFLSSDEKTIPNLIF